MNTIYGPDDDGPDTADRSHRESYSGSNDSADRERNSGRGFDRDQAEREARDAIGNAQNELQSLLENQKNAAATQVRAVADALRQTEDKLRDNGQNSVAAYVGHVADRINYWSGQLRERHIHELGQDIQNLASRQPGLFLAGALITGFVAIRFLKSTQTTDRQRSAGSTTSARPESLSTGTSASQRSDSPSDATSTRTPDATVGSSAGNVNNPDSSHF